MRPADLIAFAIAVLICAAGTAAIAGHFLRRDSRERLLLWFGLFAAIYGVRMFFQQPLADALNVDELTRSWIDVTLS